MGDIEIPRDIRRYESKFIGPFTTRQAIFFAIAAGLVLLIFNSFKDYLNNDLLFGICFFAATPAILFGFLKPYGMTLEKFLRTAFICNILAPKNRLYRSEIMYDFKPLPEEMKEEDKRMQRYKKNKRHKRDEELFAYK